MREFRHKTKIIQKMRAITVRSLGETGRHNKVLMGEGPNLQITHHQAVATVEVAARLHLSRINQ